MKTYLLPCGCGQKIEVDASQAGLQVRCSCGVELDVPTMRGLSQLATAEEEASSAPAGAAWSLRHGLLFLGGLVLAVSCAAIWFIHSNEPTISINNQSILDASENMTLEESWRAWQDILQHRLGMPTAPAVEAYHAELAVYQRRLGIAIGGAVLGLLIAVGGLIFVPKGTVVASS